MLPRVLFTVLLLFVDVFPAEALEIDWQDTPVSLEHDWNPFLNSFRERMEAPDHFLSSPARESSRFENAFVRIRPLVEVPQTLVVAFNYARAMDASFLRASVFTEKLTGLYGGADPLFVNGNPILRDGPLATVVDRGIVGGHDLRARDLITFWRAMDRLEPGILRPPSPAPPDPYVAAEATMRSALEPYFETHPDTALVIFSLNNYMKMIVTHEISHAQYFNNENYREAVTAYWDSMAEEDRRRAVAELSSQGPRYDGGSRELMINEFQAHLTSVDVQYSPRLNEMHDPHYALLKAHLIRNLPGVRLIEVPHPKPEFRLSLCTKYLLAP